MLTFKERQEINRWKGYSAYIQELSEEVNQSIVAAVCNKVKNGNLVRRVQRAWRKRDLVKSNYGKLANRIQRKWRYKKFKGLGTEYTFKNLIGTNTDQQQS